MTNAYFTHLYAGSLEVTLPVGSLQLEVSAEAPFRYIARTHYSRPLYASDWLLADDDISISTETDSTYQIEEEIDLVEVENSTLVETPSYPQLAIQLERITADTIKPIDSNHLVSDDFPRQVFRSVRELAYRETIRLSPFMPKGTTTVSFYQEDELVAEVYNLVLPGLNLSDRATSPEAMAYGLLYALANEDHALMGAQLLAIVHLAEVFSLIQKVNGQYEPAPQLGFYKEFNRYGQAIVDSEVSVYQNSFLAYALVQVIKYFRNRPYAAGIDITVYEQLKALLHNLGTLIEANTDRVSFWVIDPVPSLYSTFWASIALGEVLSVHYHRSLHSLAAQIFLTLNSPHQLSDDLPEGLLESTRYLWALLYEQDVTESLTYRSSHSQCDRLAQFWWAALERSEAPTSPANLAEETLSAWVDSDLRLYSEATFYLHAFEAQAFTTYLYQWAVYMWPTGRMWPGENSTNYGILNALFKMFAASGFDYALELSMLQNSHRVNRLQAGYLKNYSEKPALSSDKFWSAWLAKSRTQMPFAQKVDHWGLYDFGFYQEDHLLFSADRVDQLAGDLVSADELTTDAYLNRKFKHVDVWDYPLLYDKFDYNLNSEEEIFDPLRVISATPLFFQELTRPVDSQGDLVQEYVRPVPGLTYYLDASSDFTIQSHLDITADSPYAILPLSTLSAQVWVVSPPIYGPIKGLIPYGIQLNHRTYQTAATS